MAMGILSFVCDPVCVPKRTGVPDNEKGMAGFARVSARNRVIANA